MVVDRGGDLWRRLADGSGRWAYLTDEGWVGWDQRDSLPVIYQPYVGLSHDATRRILRSA
jgi:hypothetical protein